MNIGLLTPYFPDQKTKNSGIANHVDILSRELADMGENIIVIHVRPKYDNEFDKFEKQTSGRITVLTYKVCLSSWIIKLLKNHWAVLDLLLKLKMILTIGVKLNSIKNIYRIDILETSSYFSLSIIQGLLFSSLPIVVRVSTTYLQMLKDHYHFKSRLLFFFGKLEILMINRAKNLVTHAYNHALEIEKNYGISAKRFTIIPHGVNSPKERISKIDEEKLKILYVGRLEYRKGSDLLMDAIPIILLTCDEVVFEIVGLDPNGAYEETFRLKNKKWINDRVVFRGELENESVQKAYAECDIFVAPSRYESFGLIYIEAMSFGKPVIGCNVGGVSEIIADGFNGLFAETNDSKSLAEKNIRLIKNNLLRETMGKNAEETFKRKFSSKKLAIDSITYYKSILKNQH